MRPFLFLLPAFDPGFNAEAAQLHDQRWAAAAASTSQLISRTADYGARLQADLARLGHELGWTHGQIAHLGRSTARHHGLL